jgi:hypothetical protein
MIVAEVPGTLEIRARRSTFYGQRYFDLEDGKDQLACQAAKEFLLVHAVFKGLAAINEDDWNLVVEFPAQFGIAIDVHFLPRKAAAPRELGETLFHYLAEVASFARVNHNLAGKLHVVDCSVPHSWDSTNKLCRNAKESAVTLPGPRSSRQMTWKVEFSHAKF